jgi:hypothetical protein
MSPACSGVGVALILCTFITSESLGTNDTFAVTYSRFEPGPLSISRPDETTRSTVTYCESKYQTADAEVERSDNKQINIQFEIKYLTLNMINQLFSIANII